MATENKNYPLSVHIPSDCFKVNLTNYDIGKSAEMKLGTKVTFDKIDGNPNIFTTSTGVLANYIGCVSINEADTPIDVELHSTELNAIASFYNEHSYEDTDLSTSGSFTQYKFFAHYLNIFDFLDNIKIETIRLTGNFSSFSTKISSLYDSSYCTMVYRAARNNKDLSIANGILVRGNTPAKIPVLTMDLSSSTKPTDPAPKLTAVIRGFKFEYKRVMTSSHTAGSNYVYSFIFEYPEYLMANGKYRNTDIDYILVDLPEGSAASFGYSYAYGKYLFLKGTGTTFTTISEELPAL